MMNIVSRRLISLAVLLTSVFTVNAAPRSVEQAKAVALQQMKSIGENIGARIVGITDNGPRLVYSKSGKNATPCYYVFSAGDNSGFTVVSGDDRFPAIVGYTESGEFDADRLPENFVSFMQAYQDFVDNATDEQIEEVAAWKSQASHDTVAPFMKTKWNQRAPYNNMCPVYNTGKRSVTGCVATAVSQILHYYEHPANLKADIPAYTTGTYRLEMKGITAGEEYDWSNMMDVYTGSETQAQNDAVAKLMFHVGCALKTDYGPSSPAYTTLDIFTRYFGMDKELVGYYVRADYQIAEWDYMLYKEIEARRPVYYDGQSNGGGHAFVIHGYADGLYYVNWGWGGDCDGYFDITILNPNSTTGAGVSSTNDGYSMKNGMIIGLYPDNGIVDEVCTAVFKATSLNIDKVAISNGNVTASATVSVANFNPVENTRFVSIGYIDENFQIQNVATPKLITIVAGTETRASVKTTACDILFPCVDGIYKLDVIESTDKNNWMVCSKHSNYNSVYFEVRNGAVNIVDSPLSLTAKAELDNESCGYAGMNNKINVNVINGGVKEYYDIVYVKVSDSSDMPEKNIYATGITAPVGGSTTFSFNYAPQSVGTYNFWILDKDNNEIGRSSIEFDATTAPVLSFVSIKCANASGEKVFAKLGGSDYNVEMDKVNDTKAEFVFEIKNDGGYYEGQFLLYSLNEKGSWSYNRVETLRIPANATTKFTFIVEGNVGNVVGYKLLGYDNSVSIAPLTTPNKHILQGNSMYYSFNDGEICYLAGSDTGVNSIRMDRESNVYYNLRGENVVTPNKGVYIKNGKKYIIK